MSSHLNYSCMITSSVTNIPFFFRDTFRSAEIQIIQLDYKYYDKKFE
jgi:hypothetical protein